jgi:hypothetical protein
MIDRSAGDGAIRLDRWTVTSGSNVNSRAAVVIRAGGHDWKASAEGNGAVDALYQAVDRALSDVLGGHPALLEYDVHALAEGPDAEGQVAVRIAPPPASPGARAEGRFSGEASSTNTIASSVEAYIAALNRMLETPAWAGATAVAAEAAARRRRARGPEAGTGAPAEFDVEAADLDPNDWFNR